MIRQFNRNKQLNNLFVLMRKASYYIFVYLVGLLECVEKRLESREMAHKFVDSQYSHHLQKNANLTVTNAHRR
jgi:hypothetical protein